MNVVNWYSLIDLREKKS